MNDKVDTITLRGLKVRGTHGVLEHEHIEPQDFVVDVVLEVATSRAIESDDVADTVSYADVAETVTRVVSGEHVDLIETLADRIADELLALGPRVVDVTVHKPNAPMPYTFEDVSVTAERMGLVLKPAQHRVVIALGSNLEDPVAHICEAIIEMGSFVNITAVSGLYSSAPVLAPGQAKQPDYINAVVVGTSFDAPLALLYQLHELEYMHGRERLERWGARTLDLDIVSIDDITLNDPEITVPHPRAAERRFMLEPWLDADPHAILNGEPVADLMDAVKDQECTPLGIFPDLPIYGDGMQGTDHFNSASNHFATAFGLGQDMHFYAEDFDFDDIRPEDFGNLIVGDDASDDAYDGDTSGEFTCADDPSGEATYDGDDAPDCGAIADNTVADDGGAQCGAATADSRDTSFSNRNAHNGQGTDGVEHESPRPPHSDSEE